MGAYDADVARPMEDGGLDGACGHCELRDGHTGTREKWCCVCEYVVVCKCSCVSRWGRRIIDLYLRRGRLSAGRKQV